MRALMRRADFHFELPPELIAQAPLPERSASRLLVLDGKAGALALYPGTGCVVRIAVVFCGAIACE